LKIKHIYSTLELSDSTVYLADVEMRRIW